MLHRDRLATALGGMLLSRRGLLAAVCVLGMHAGTNVRAADEPEVTLVAEVRQEIEIAPGRRIVRLVPAGALVQGQEIFYTVRIRNPSTLPMRDVEVVQRIPQNTVFVPNSAGGPGAEIMMSADGGLTFGKEGQLTLVDQSALALMQAPNVGRSALTRPATAQDYTHIRWRLHNPLAPGAVALARFRAVFQ